MDSPTVYECVSESEPYNWHKLSLGKETNENAPRYPLPAAALLNHFETLHLRNASFQPILSDLQSFHNELEALTNEYNDLHDASLKIHERPLEVQREHHTRLSAFAQQTSRKVDLQRRLDEYWRSTAELKRHVKEHSLDDMALPDFDDVAQLQRWWKHLNNYHRRFWRGAVPRLVRGYEGDRIQGTGFSNS